MTKYSMAYIHTFIIIMINTQEPKNCYHYKKKAPRDTRSRKQKYIYVFGKLSVYLEQNKSVNITIKV